MEHNSTILSCLNARYHNILQLSDNSLLLIDSKITQQKPFQTFLPPRSISVLSIKENPFK